MSSKQSHTGVILTILAITAASRVFHVLPNMAPMTALAVFGAWTFSNARLAYIVPILAMILGDVALAVVNNDMSYAWHDTQAAVYACLLATAWMSRRLATEASPARRAGSVLAGSLLFFVATNFAVWLGSGMYEQSLNGLATCYAMALPFFRNSLISDVVYAALMFGAYELARRSMPVRVKA